MTAVTHNIGKGPDDSGLVISVYDDLPAAGAALCDGIAVSGSPGIVGYMNVFFSSSKGGTLTVTRVDGDSNSWSEKLNGGSAVIATAAFAETVEVLGGETLNFAYTGETGSYKLRVAAVIQR